MEETRRRRRADDLCTREDSRRNDKEGIWLPAPEEELSAHLGAWEPVQEL